MDNEETTSDVKLFQKFNVEPSIDIHEVWDNYPQLDESMNRLSLYYQII